MSRSRAQVLLYGDAAPTAGFGHVRRIHALAAALKGRGLRSAVLLRNRGPGVQWLVARDETVHFSDTEADEAEALPQAVRRCGAAVVVADVPAPVGRRVVSAVRRVGSAVVLVENDGPGRLTADLVVSAAVRPDLTWRGAVGQHVASPAFAILGEQFRPVPRRQENAVRLFVTMGANDAGGLTLDAFRAVEQIEDALQPILVLGPGCGCRARLLAALGRAAHPWEVHCDLPEMAPVVAGADLALVAFGLAAYEVAAAGLPQVLVPHRPADRWHAERFAAAGAALIAEPDPAAMAEALKPLAIGSELRRRVGLAAERFVDGRGAERVAELVADLVVRARRADRDRRRGAARPS